MSASKWCSWIAQNLLRGVSEELIVSTAATSGFAEENLRAEITRIRGDPIFAAAQLRSKQLRKLEGLMDLYSTLYKQSAAGIPEFERDELSAQDFYSHCYFLNRPAVIRRFAQDWPATRRWSPKDFAERFPDITVEITERRNSDPNYDQNVHWHKAVTTLGEFSHRVENGKATNDYYLVALNFALENVQLKALLDDIEFPDRWLAQDKCCRAAVSLWFGPKGTTTPLHHDGNNILFVQVHGRKWFKMIPSFEIHRVYNHEGVYSAVDAEHPNFKEYPDYADATPTDVTLAPGDALFIPVGWWHWVRSLDISISLGFKNFAAPGGNVVWDQRVRFM